MAQPDQWETKLGWLGALLAGQDARHVEIFNRETFVTVSWDRVDGSRQESSFTPEDLARPWAPYRQRSDSLSRSTLLGTLGREIDREKIDVASILEEEDGFLVTGSMSGRYQNRSFSYPELQASASRPATTQEPPATTSGPTPVFV